MSNFSRKEQDSQDKEEHEVLCLIFLGVVIILPWWKEPSKNESLVGGPGGSYVTYCFNGIQQMQPYRMKWLCLIFLFLFFFFHFPKWKQRENERALLPDIRRLICYYPFGIMACSNWAQILVFFFSFFFFHSLHNDYDAEWEMAQAHISGILSTNRFRYTAMPRCITAQTLHPRRSLFFCGAYIILLWRKLRYVTKICRFIVMDFKGLVMESVDVDATFGNTSKVQHKSVYWKCIESEPE